MTKFEPGDRVRCVKAGGYDLFKPKGKAWYSTIEPEALAKHSLFPEEGKEYEVEEVAPGGTHVSLVVFGEKRGFPVRDFVNLGTGDGDKA